MVVVESALRDRAWGFLILRDAHLTGHHHLSQSQSHVECPGLLVFALSSERAAWTRSLSFNEIFLFVFCLLPIDLKGGSQSFTPRIDEADRAIFFVSDGLEREVEAVGAVRTFSALALFFVASMAFSLKHSHSTCSLNPSSTFAKAIVCRLPVLCARMSFDVIVTEHIVHSHFDSLECLGSISPSPMAGEPEQWLRYQEKRCKPVSVIESQIFPVRR